jgi:transcriptional regulator with XRE-family HTH domain
MNKPGTPYTNAVAAEVRACLARRNMTANQAAKELGWTQPYISRRLSGQVVFNVRDLNALADLLGVSVIRFFQIETDLAQPSDVKSTFAYNDALREAA